MVRFRFHAAMPWKLSVLCILCAVVALPVQGKTYLLEPGADLIGELRTVTVREGETLMDIARAEGLGYNDIRLANPGMRVWLPEEGAQVIIPSQFLLPDAPREGIVLNRGELRLYHYHSDPRTGAPLVTTYPMGIGREDRQTPTGRSRVTMKLENPAWYPTSNVKADYAARGEHLPGVIPPGPDNPLGKYALVLDIPGYLIHGTNRPDGIGMRVSQGCVRLYPEDIAALVYQVPKGAPVTIVDEAIKLGIKDGRLLAEVHPAVYEEAEQSAAQREQELLRRITSFLDARGDEVAGQIDWNRVTQAAQEADGIPIVISH